MYLCRITHPITLTNCSRGDTMFDEFVRKCKELGKSTTDEPSDEELSRRLAKIIVSERINDEDAFEIARQAYDEGQTTEV
jgi:hypothetical protein